MTCVHYCRLFKFVCLTIAGTTKTFQKLLFFSLFLFFSLLFFHHLLVQTSPDNTATAWEISLNEGQSIIFSIGGSSLIQWEYFRLKPWMFFVHCFWQNFLEFYFGQHLDNNYLSQTIALTSMPNSCSAQTSVCNIKRQIHKNKIRQI